MATKATEPTWSELLGSNNWNGLLDPLDLSLRSLILRCGDFCQATYDSFINDANSKYAGSSRYGKKSFFQKVMLQNASDYQVYCFLYATAKVSVPEAILLHSLSREAWDSESNWIGYIATTSDETSKSLGRRVIYAAWRGTSRYYEWIDVFSAKPESANAILKPKSWNKKEGKEGDEDSKDDDEKEPKVMYGWLTIYVSEDPKSSFTKTSARKQFLGKMNALIEKYKDEKLSIVISGHSLGASLSILSAFDLVENGVTDIPVTAIVFGCPQVGNKAFNDRILGFPNLKILNVKNKIDMIPLYPSGLFGYVNSGIPFEIDTRKSPNLKDSMNPSDWHNLQAMLHVVDGWNGPNGKFELKIKRSLALVNKSSAFLKDEYLFPESWWTEKNKGMVIDDNGEWILAPPDEEDLPVPED
ncbi:hypothetical protein ACH5RR_028531 [Cinchona calisaya]|uniref:Phospholipase A1 n=1 Tax=Cinchona calisaya TaxID=153742 RepID=A0ABD2YSP1_9GENT